MNKEDVIKNIPEKNDANETNELIEIVGVSFKRAGKIYYFAPGGISVSIGDAVIVETARGIEMGYIKIDNKNVPVSEITPPLRPVIRIATPSDIARVEENHRLEVEAAKICAEKIAAHKLEMKLVGAEYTFDNNKLLFYFTSEGRVDFRELVKDLASVFKTRIELRQIGIRDEAKLLGGLGVCGRPFCCSSFLSDFTQVSIKMAKEQNFSLNSTKISGSCGRLMCCLRYEHETYEEEIKLTPPVGSVVKTANGNGIIIETRPLTHEVRVKLDEKSDTPQIYNREDVKVLSRGKGGKNTEKNAKNANKKTENSENDQTIPTILE